MRAYLGISHTLCTRMSEKSYICQSENIKRKPQKFRKNHENFVYFSRMIRPSGYIFRGGARNFLARRLIYGFQVTTNAKNLRVNGFHFPIGASTF